MSLILVVMTTLVWGAPDPVEILKDTDRARGQVGQGVSWRVQVLTTEADEKSQRDFLVKVLENNSRVEALAPPRDRGQVFLFNDRSMWFFKPGLGRPVSISTRQRLTGQAANGDIASTNFARDYTPTLEKESTVGKSKVWVLLLKAKDSNVTYDQIRYYVDTKTRLAVKAEFLTTEGKPFKIGMMKYNNSLKLKGKKIPFISEFLIQDAQNTKNQSVLKYSKLQSEKLNPAIFNVNMLSR